MRMKIEDLCYSYGEKPAVDKVSLTVHKGEFVALSAPMGAGNPPC